MKTCVVVKMQSAMKTMKPVAKKYQLSVLLYVVVASVE